MKKFTIEGYPSIFRRFFAIIYDFFLIIAILITSMAIMVVIRLCFGESLNEREIAISGAWRIPSFIFCLFNISLFFCYFWVNNGQTLGMQAWRLAIVNVNNECISWKQAYLRCFIAPFSLLFGLAGYFFLFFNQDKQTLHDKLSNTRTVLLKKT